MPLRFFLLSISIALSLVTGSQILAQQFSYDEFVTYSYKSSFIKEFDVPVDEYGLRGIVSDPVGNVWVYHSTSTTSSIFKFEPKVNQFTKYEIKEVTKTNDAITNLSGGQLVYDENENKLWFTDSRTNSIGSLDVQSSEIHLYPIPTVNAGPMGIIFSQDHENLWFTELNADKIANFDLRTGMFMEYPLKENSGPTLLYFDKDGYLWATMSYSNSILQINSKGLQSGIKSAIKEYKLPKGDDFSPFGITVFSENEKKIVTVSDHGSSRIIVSDISTNLEQYSSYWSSESLQYPQTLPSQIIYDGKENIYYPLHGGNKISKLNIKSGIITEFEIPTGPLSTVIYLTLDPEGRVWFTEVLSNKIGYLDSSIPVPLRLGTSEKLVIQDYSTKSLESSIVYENMSSPISIENVDISLSGMTHSGIIGISFDIVPQKIDLSEHKRTNPRINIFPQNDLNSGFYNIMIKATVKEVNDDRLEVSVLYPFEMKVEIPEKKIEYTSKQNELLSLPQISIRDVIQIISLSVAIGLSSLIVIRKIRSKINTKK